MDAPATIKGAYRRNAEDKPRFGSRRPGDKTTMIGVAIGLIILGIVFLFVVPWVGIVAGIVGLILLVGFLLGFGRVPRRRNVSDRPT